MWRVEDVTSSHGRRGRRKEWKKKRKSDWDRRDTFFHRLVSFFLNNSFSKWGRILGLPLKNSPSLSFGTVHTVRKESRYERRRNMKKGNKKIKDNIFRKVWRVPAFHSVRSELFLGPVVSLDRNKQKKCKRMGSMSPIVFCFGNISLLFAIRADFSSPF